MVSFFANEDFISLWHHIYDKNSFNKVQLSELGPRFEMRPFMLRLGTLLEKNATI